MLRIRAVFNWSGRVVKVEYPFCCEKRYFSLITPHTFQENIPDVEQLPLPQNSLRAWELDILLRTRTLEQITSAKLTLKVSFLVDFGE